MHRVAMAIAAGAVALSVGPGLAAASTRWVPKPTDRFQLVLSSTPASAQLRGPFSVMEVDGFDTPTSTVAALHALGKRAVCYIDVGTWEQWRPDAARFPRSVLGRADGGWPGERWLDIRRQSVLLPIMRSRLAMCVRKGFDAVDPDNVNGDQNATGFALTESEQLSYDRAIAAVAHADGLAVALKSDAAESVALAPSFDFVVDEQCAGYHECGAFGTFILARKPVFDIEYTSSLSFCASLPKGVFGIAKHLSLDAWVRRCP